MLKCREECSLLKKNRGVIKVPILIWVVVFLAMTIVVVVAEGGMDRVAVLVVTLLGEGEVVVVVEIVVAIRDVLL